MDGNANTHSLREAISLITIAAILVAIGCYVAELYNVPILAPCLFWLAVRVYHLFPALSDLPGSQVPMLVAAASAGAAFFIVTTPLAHWLASVFSRQGIQSLERQTLRLKRHREKLKNRTRNSDRFYVD